MITQQIKERVLKTEAFKIKLITEYKEWLTAHSFPIAKAFESSTLTEILKMRTFEALLKADKSTATRFDLLKDKAAKQAFINDKVNLTGYPEIDTIRRYISAIGNGLDGSDYTIDAHDLLASELDINQALDAQVFQWGANTTYTQVQQMAKCLTDLYKVYRAVVPGESDSPLHFIHELRHGSPFDFDFATDGTIEANELSAARYVAEQQREARVQAEYNRLHAPTTVAAQRKK